MIDEKPLKDKPPGSPLQIGKGTNNYLKCPNDNTVNLYRFLIGHRAIIFGAPLSWFTSGNIRFK